jgi:protein-tyrosine kinase
MAKIEEALAKLQRAAAASRAPPAPKLPIARVVEPVPGAPPAEHTYGGKHIEVDAAALRTQGLLAPDSYTRRLADEYRVIKRPLLRNASRTQEPLLPRGNLLMVGSAVAGEGKTFTCLNLCLSIAREKDWTVVLVDADCSKPHLTRLFGAEEQPGLLELLRDPSLTFEQLVMPTNVPGLALLPAGKRDEHAAELLASERMAALCGALAEADSQRMVVFDSSPLLLTTEAPVLASHMGQIVMVVQANRTPQQAVLSALEKLDRSKAINLILNRDDSGQAALGYGYGYGDYGT